MTTKQTWGEKAGGWLVMTGVVALAGLFASVAWRALS